LLNHISTLQSTLQAEMSLGVNIIEHSQCLLTQIELMAFSLTLVSFVTNQSRQSDFLDFLNQCFGISEGKFSFDFDDSQSCLRYAASIVSAVQRLSQGLSAEPNLSIDFSNRPSIFLDHFQALADNFDELRRNLDSIPATPFHASINSITPLARDSSALEDWLFTHSCLNLDNSQYRILVFRLSHRLTVAKSHQENITSLRQLTDLQRDIDGCD
jgi:hypothetical protein